MRRRGRSHRAVHRLRHEQRQQGARGADEHPRDDEDGRVEHEAGGRCGEAGERVQQRDDDGHVRAADREHEHHAEHEREDDERDDRPLRLEPGDDRDSERGAAAENEHVDDVLPGKHDRAPADELLELRERDERAGERDRADERRKRDRQRLVPDEHAVELVELRERDERRRAAADPVEQGHHLRHRGHLHLACADDADDAPDRRCDHDQRPVRDPLDERAWSRSRRASRRRRASSRAARASGTRGSGARGRSRRSRRGRGARGRPGRRSACRPSSARVAA